MDILLLCQGPRVVCGEQTCDDTSLLPASSFRTDTWDDATRFEEPDSGDGE